MSPGSLLPKADCIDTDRLPVDATIGLSLSALLWLVLLEGWLPFPSPAGIDVPTTAPGVPEVIGTTNGLFGVSTYLLMWGTMMLAMMLPSMVPAIRKFRRSQCGTMWRRGLPFVTFLGVYGLAWTATGAVPLAVEQLVSIRDLATVHGRFLVAGTLLFAGVYQLTPLKRRLLKRCRDCHSVPHRPRIVDGIRYGFAHAVDCIACTWALFALMVALGSMNVSVMIAITLAVALERIGREGESFAVAMGVLLLTGGLLTLLGVGPFVG